MSIAASNRVIRRDNCVPLLHQLEYDMGLLIVDQIPMNLAVGENN